MIRGRKRYPSVGSNPVVASSMIGWPGNGMTQAKFVPEPVKRVSTTSRSVPLEKQINARWSGMLMWAGTARGGNTRPSARAARGKNQSSKNETIRCILIGRLITAWPEIKTISSAYGITSVRPASCRNCSSIFWSSKWFSAASIKLSRLAASNKRGTVT